VKALYVDSSAVAKLITRESESAALRDFILGDNPWQGPVSLVSSRLTSVEVWRMAQRIGPHLLQTARAVLNTITMVEFSRENSEQAARLHPVELRTLDALHLAAALRVGLDVVTYDRRMAEAAANLGLEVFAPGSAGE
jgi:predicted nucleic acid-binding protein